MSNMKFVIVSPKQCGGGPIALHRLCKELQYQGYNARILYFDHIYKKGQCVWKYWVNWWHFSVSDVFLHIIGSILKNTRFSNEKWLRGYTYVPVRGTRRKWFPFIDKNTIVIYPEICYGNILGAKRVVRWLLYYYRFAEDNTAYGKDDLFICYREVFNDLNLNPKHNELHVVNFDSDMYRQTNYELREGNCYIVRKGSKRKDVPANFDGPIIDGLSESEIVSLFNKCKYCISYDTQTFYSSIAAICGCISVVVPEPGKTRKDYCDDESGYGIAYGFSNDELEYAIKTRENEITRVKSWDIENANNVIAFVELCKSYFDR